jgi:hypothetical protein
MEAYWRLVGPGASTPTAPLSRTSPTGAAGQLALRIALTNVGSAWVIQPLSASIYSEFLEKHGEALHLGTSSWISSWRGPALGYEVIQSGQARRAETANCVPEHRGRPIHRLRVDGAVSAVRA